MDESVSKRWAIPFFAIWTGQLLSVFGSAVVGFSLVWWLTKTTGSGTILATASLAGLLPHVIISPFAGALVDRLNRRLVMMVADALVALATALLVILFATGVIQVWHIYLLMVARSIASSFHHPAMQASTTLMVPKRHLARVAGLNQAFFNGLLNIISPPLGALVVGFLPMHQVMMIDILSAALAIFPLFFVRIPEPVRQKQAYPTSPIRSYLADLKGGIQYLAGWPGLVAVLVLAAMLNFLFNPAFSLMPLLITSFFKGGAPEIGWMDSAFGVGVIAGGLALSVWGGFKRKIVTSMLGLIGMGGGVLAIGLVPSWAYWLAVGCMAFVGIMNPICNGPLSALMQARVTPEMQGRVFSLVNAVAAGMAPLGLALAGPVADWLGVRFWFTLAGGVAMLAGISALFIPVILHIEDNGHQPHAAAAISASVPSPSSD